MSDVASLIQSLSNFGGLGIVVAFLIWWNFRADRQRQQIYDQQLAKSEIENERRFAYEKERLSCDKELAASLAALTAAIQTRLRS